MLQNLSSNMAKPWHTPKNYKSYIISIKKNDKYTTTDTYGPSYNESPVLKVQKYTTWAQTFKPRQIYISIQIYLTLSTRSIQIFDSSRDRTCELYCNRPHNKYANAYERKALWKKNEQNLKPSTFFRCQ